MLRRLESQALTCPRDRGNSKDREELYWHRANAHLFGSEADPTPALEKLVEYGRPAAAVELVHRMHHDGSVVPPALVTKALLSITRSEEKVPDRWTLGGVIKALQSTPGVDPEELKKVEWVYLPILDGEDDRRPITLERAMAKDPHSFCEIVSAAFWPRGSPPPEADLTESQKSLAQNAYRLLDRWSIVPGTDEGGSFDSGVFSDWLDGVIGCSEASGHVEVAMELVGHVLVHAPPDPDGLWLHRGVAARLNESEWPQLREGFRNALYNSRGVYYYTGGEAERTLAEQYRGRADAVEAEGFHRVATTLRDLAESYDRQAVMEVERHERDR